MGQLGRFAGRAWGRNPLVLQDVHVLHRNTMEMLLLDKSCPSVGEGVRRSLEQTW